MQKSHLTKGANQETLALALQCWCVLHVQRSPSGCVDTDVTAEGLIELRRIAEGRRTIAIVFPPVSNRGRWVTFGGVREQQLEAMDFSGNDHGRKLRQLPQIGLITSVNRSGYL